MAANRWIGFTIVFLSSVTIAMNQFIEGVGSAFISIAAPTVIAANFQENERGKPMGIWASWIPVGVMLIFNLTTLMGTVVGGALLDAKRSLKMLITVSGIVMLVVATVSFSLRAAWILPFMAVMGLTGGVVIVCCFTGAARKSATPAEIPWAIAICTVACFLGHLTAPVAVGAVVERFGWFSGTIVVGIGPLIIFAAAFVYARFGGGVKTGRQLGREAFSQARPRC